MIDRIGKWFSDSFLDFPFDASYEGFKTDVLNGWVHILMLILFVFCQTIKVPFHQSSSA